MDSRPLLMFVHSPLLGPYSWSRVAAMLAAEGFPVAQPDLRPALLDPPPYYPNLTGAALLATELRGAPNVVLIGHSAAGPLLPAITEALGGRAARVDAVVFVDARLPHPGLSWVASMDDHRAGQLRAMAATGWLPRWDTWFPEGAIEREVPDPRLRERLVAEARPLPAALLDEPAPARTPLFEATTRVYMRLSAGYDDPAGRAERLGWPVVRVESSHLAPLTNPDEIVGLLRTTVLYG